eukprot:Hpha_TRINITY_DN33924_c0_g1::TRINITY_DN33924_c0_g1_i1::g.69339::m.69339/K01190/lacZ; beta-galactosidase
MVFHLLAVVVTFATPLRESINFDLAWRQLRGPSPEPPFACPANAFSNASFIRCNGLHFNAAPTADTCANACCMDTKCAVWQWEDPASKGGGCWMGVPSTFPCDVDQPTWIGGNRTVPAPPLPINPQSPSNASYDDSSWAMVNAPHDFLIDHSFSADNREQDGYLSRNTSWYRKHFNLPSDYKGRSVWVQFDAVFHVTSMFLNSHSVGQHNQGYSQFQLRLDNATGTRYGDGTANENVLALYVDAMVTSSWWYAGGGLFNHVNLLSLDMLHVAFNGVYSWGEVTGTISSDARSAESGRINGWVELQNDGGNDETAHVAYTVTDASGKVVAEGTTVSTTVKAGTQPPFPSVSFSVDVDSPQLWSVQQPALYSLTTTVVDSSGTSRDSVTTTVGIRRMDYSGDTGRGFMLNGQHVVHTGFCDHDNFGGQGMAVLDRTNLYRAQMLRAVGGNARRFSHNAPVPIFLDIYDRLGVLNMPEHRNFKNGIEYFDAFRAMVRTDRNHPSIAFFSFCNEAGCRLDESDTKVTAFTMQDIAKSESPATNLTANMFAPQAGDNLTLAVDVQGFSHQNSQAYATFHAKYPTKPLVGSECCSCQNDRHEDFNDKSHLSPFSSVCAAKQTQETLGFNYTVGTYTWTLTDYIGEGHSWPRKSSSFGQFDLSGFPKAAAYFYRSMWLQNRDEDTAGRPPIDVFPSVHIANTWDPRPSAVDTDTRTITVHAGAVSSVDVSVNGKSQGKQKVSVNVSPSWHNIPFVAGSLVATGYAANGSAVATHTVYTSAAPTSIVLSLDAPSPRTGTGTGKLVSDAEDGALIRATIVDASGRISLQATNNVTFSIVSGPAVVVGTDNGDPAGIENESRPYHSAFHGLVRCVIRSSEDAATPVWHRDRLLQIHGAGRLAAAGIKVTRGDGALPSASSVVVQATSPGLKTATLTIPLSTAPEVDGVLASATAFSTGVALQME